jgi:hypothetical protein
MLFMAQFIDDVETEIAEIGGIDGVRARWTDCMSAGSHHWQDLQTNYGKTVKYCEDCKIVDLGGYLFWPVTPQ